MTNETTLFGKSSYEYAIGCFKASPKQPLKEEQFARLYDSDMETALKLLSEYGYPLCENSGSVSEAIEEGMAETRAFIRKNSPDLTFTNLLFYEEDALNLKIMLKAKMNNINLENFTLADGGIDKEVLEVCAEIKDFSLIGDDMEKNLSGIEEINDPGQISCMVDNAIFTHSLTVAKKKGYKPLYKLMKTYSDGRNRLTALRLKNLGKNPADYGYAFLGGEIPDAKGKPEDILADVARKLDNIINELSFDENVGYIARYWFIKKNEAARLRLLFAEKNLTNGGGNGND